MKKEITKHFPEHSTYKTYIEAFGGGASILFEKEQSPIEIYNDLEENVYSLFKVLSNKNLFDEFRELTDLSLFSRKLRSEFEQELKQNGLNIVDRAFRYWYVNRTSYSGSGGFSINTSVRRKMCKSTSDFLSTVENLEQVHQRLSVVVIENIDGIKLIQKYNDNSVFMYLDPPYFPDTRIGGVYKVEMTNEQHKELIDTLIKSKSKVLLSGYDNAEYKRLENNGWNKIDFIVNTISNERIPRTKTESLWKNY